MLFQNIQSMTVIVTIVEPYTAQAAPPRFWMRRRLN